jgi:hypothetical protein
VFHRILRRGRRLLMVLVAGEVGVVAGEEKQYFFVISNIQQFVILVFFYV